MNPKFYQYFILTDKLKKKISGCNRNKKKRSGIAIRKHTFIDRKHINITCRNSGEQLSNKFKLIARFYLHRLLGIGQ